MRVTQAFASAPAICHQSSRLVCSPVPFPAPPCDVDGDAGFCISDVTCGPCIPCSLWYRRHPAMTPMALARPGNSEVRFILGCCGLARHLRQHTGGSLFCLGGPKQKMVFLLCFLSIRQARGTLQRKTHMTYCDWLLFICILRILVQQRYSPKFRQLRTC